MQHSHDRDETTLTRCGLACVLVDIQEDAGGGALRAWRVHLYVTFLFCANLCMCSRVTAFRRWQRRVPARLRRSAWRRAPAAQLWRYWWCVRPLDVECLVYTMDNDVLGNDTLESLLFTNSHTMLSEYVRRQSCMSIYTSCSESPAWEARLV